MKVLNNDIQTTYTIKKSKFLCFGYLISNKDNVTSIIKSLKKDYPDASHICYAYVLDDKTYYFTDAGEPSGTAGQPIYNALKTNDINYCLFVVIRYFGGIKFGPGPLRQTYRDVTLDTIKQAKLKECVYADVISIEVPYDQIKKVSNSLRLFIKNKSFKNEKAILTLVGDKKTILGCLNNLHIKPTSIKEKQVV